jgi:hypothetical protein
MKRRLGEFLMEREVNWEEDQELEGKRQREAERKKVMAEQAKQKKAEAEQAKRKKAEAEEAKRKKAEAEEAERRKAEAEEAERRKAEAEEAKRLQQEEERRERKERKKMQKRRKAARREHRTRIGSKLRKPARPEARRMSTSQNSEVELEVLKRRMAQLQAGITSVPAPQALTARSEGRHTRPPTPRTQSKVGYRLFMTPLTPDSQAPRRRAEE